MAKLNFTCDENGNTGDKNLGSLNTGRNNLGNSNCGNYNNGYWNAGNKNDGHWNNGNCNNGMNNVGDFNKGEYNSGSCNVGLSNSGFSNYGIRNSGSFNAGSYNSGSWNICDYSTGFFNTITPDEILVFNKPCKKLVWDKCMKPKFLTLELVNSKFVDTESMTDQEKKDNPGYEVMGGYLRVIPYKEAFRESWDNATIDDKRLILSMPNFDNDIFIKITGIDVMKELFEYRN